MKENITKLENQIEKLELEYKELQKKIKIIENTIYRKKTILHIKNLLNRGWNVDIAERFKFAYSGLISLKRAKIEIKFLIKKGGNINKIIEETTILDLAIKQNNELEATLKCEETILECYEKLIFRGDLSLYGFKCKLEKQLKYVKKWILILRKLGALTKEELDNLKSK